MDREAVIPDERRSSRTWVLRAASEMCNMLSRRLSIETLLTKIPGECQLFRGRRQIHLKFVHALHSGTGSAPLWRILRCTNPPVERFYRR
jgi:hypothetical protein